MMLFILGLVIGFAIMPVKRFYVEYKWFRNIRVYSIRASLNYALKDIWRM